MSALIERERPPAPDRDRRGWRVDPRRLALPAALVALAGLVRVVYLTSSRANFNGDEAVTGVMVRHMLHGEHFWFYPGQHYGGTLEGYLQAASYFVFRMPQNPVTLRLTQVALSMATTALIYLCARRMLPSVRQAAFAAGFFAIAPWFNVLEGATSLGFYVVGVTAGTGALYCALRLGGSRLANAGWMFGLALCAGLGFWNSLTSAYLVLPAVLWALPYLVREVGTLGAAVFGALLGAAPALRYMLHSHQLPVPGPGPFSPSLAQRLYNLTDPLLREFLGITYAHTSGGLPTVLQYLVLALLAVGYAVCLWRRRRGLVHLVALRRDRREPVDLLLVAPVLVAVLYMSSSQAWYTGSPRYLVAAYPLLALGLAAVLPARRPRWSLVVYPLVLALSAVLCLGFFRYPITPPLRERDAVLSRVVDTLVRMGETRVYADYFTAMPLQYLAGDRLEVAVCHGAARFPATQARVAREPHPVYLGSPLAGSGLLSDPAGGIRTALTNAHVSFRTTTVGFVEIYDQLAPAVPASVACR